MFQPTAIAENDVVQHSRKDILDISGSTAPVTYKIENCVRFYGSN